MTLALSFENISKQYRLGEVGAQTLLQDVQRVWSKATGQGDPHLNAGGVNDRASVGGEFVWALRDIAFDVQQGEVFGIIGQNGAGKSTLLKLLSRVTAPTTGRIRANGRVASLLEVGTGFHPELTGRENIFLNGAILGMSRSQIKDKLEQIVDFSGCARYIDTPAKRYSSGMMVRLGFAVAAHLECEILVIDEVLAVGDAAYQKKCIGRMGEVANDGRTVLFVSHNMQSVEQLCTRACVLKQGQMAMIGDVTDAISTYFGTYVKRDFDEHTHVGNAALRRGDGSVRFSRIQMQNAAGDDVAAFKKGDQARLIFNAIASEAIPTLRAQIVVHSGITREEVTSVEFEVAEQLTPGQHLEFAIDLDTTCFRTGSYPLQFCLRTEQGSVLCDSVEGVTRPLSIVDDGNGRMKGMFDIESHVLESAS